MVTAWSGLTSVGGFPVGASFLVMVVTKKELV